MKKSPLSTPRCTSVALLILATTQSLIATNLVWDGGAGATDWTNPTNWVGDAAPVAGDSLTFDGATQLTNANTFAAGTNFAGITYNTTGFVQTGNSINLSGDINYVPTTGVATTAIPFVLQQNISSDVAGASTLNLNGIISGGFSFTKTGSGLLAASVGHTFTGGLNVNGGTFRTTVSGNTSLSLGTGQISISGNATVELRSTSATTFNNALNLGTGGGRIMLRGNHFVNPSAITGTGSLTLGPTGSDGIVGTTADMKGWNGTLNLTKNDRTAFTFRLATAFVNDSLKNAAVVVGDAVGQTRQNGTNTAGTIVTDIGTLSSAATNSSWGGSAAGTGYFVYSIGSRNENSVFSGNFNNGGSKTALRKVGTASLTLAGTNNTFSAPSSVDAGTLAITGTLAAADLAITVNPTGTLAGNGTIAGIVTTAGGTIAPGNSPGTLTIGTLNLDSSATLAFEMNGGDTTVGSNVNDLLSISGNITLDGTLNVSETIALSFSTATVGSTWRLVNYVGTLTDNGLVLGSQPALPANTQLNIDTSTPQQVNLVLNAIPEPSTLLTGLCSAMLLLFRRRR
jgi:autotransporter-associated beta strand protein